jgi:hypothetical protein
MIISFIAGMVFMVVLAQTLMIANRDTTGTSREPAASEDQNSITPAIMPGDDYLPDEDIYGLVYASPGREVM